MFPFGSFLTNIPLIILASAYMLYFGAYALNKTKAKDNAILYQEKEQYVKNSSVQTHGNIFYYQQAFNGKQVARSNAGDIKIFQEHFIFLPHYIPDRKISFHFYRCSLFPRPPPYLG
ncbi:MAG: hypothetical protein Q8N38_11135 [Bacteroidales bacterium]|nr:hypothetical protein [Bacteroidales bacterium]